MLISSETVFTERILSIAAELVSALGHSDLSGSLSGESVELARELISTLILEGKKHADAQPKQTGSSTKSRSGPDDNMGKLSV